MQKNIIVVLGMGRSGTSIISRAINLLGIPFGNNLIAANEVNPTGFTEDYEVLEINEAILHALGYEWSNLGLHPSDLDIKHPTLLNLSEKALSLLKQHLKDNTCWGFKDPRTARLLSFWQPLFASLNLEEKYIITLRNPLASAKSYSLHFNIDVEHGMLLWLRHLIPAIHYTHTKQRLLISYESLVDSPEKQLDRIKNFLNISANQETFFIDKKLNRSAATYDEFKSDPSTPSFMIKIYDLLNDVAADKLSLYDQAFLQEWETLTCHLNNTPLYQPMDRFLKKISLLQQERSSLSQKISVFESWINVATLGGKLKTPLKQIEKLYRQLTSL